MKTLLLVAGLNAVLAWSALGAADTIIRERAKQLRDQNNARQGVAPGSRPATPPNAANLPSPEQQLMNRVSTDLALIKTNTTPTMDQKIRLANDLMAMAKGPNRPPRPMITKLSEQMALAVSEKPLSAAQRAKLAQDLDAILNPGRYPHANLSAIIEDVQAIFKSSGLGQTSVAAIGDQVRGISAEVQKPGSSAEAKKSTSAAGAEKPETK